MGPPRRMITSHDYDIADRRTHVCPLGRFFCEYYVHPSFDFTTVMFTLPLYMILILMQHVLLGHASQRMNEKNMFIPLSSIMWGIKLHVFVLKLDDIRPGHNSLAPTNQYL